MMLKNASIMALLYAVVLLLSLSSASAQDNSEDPQGYLITTTWNGTIPADEPRINVTFASSTDGAAVGLLISVKAPYYNNTGPDVEPGYADALWNYEVVEVFLLGPNEKYLEIELGPKGHYLTYFLEGIRNMTNNSLPITYTAEINEDESAWSGSALIPIEYLPEGVNSFNAYAIHNLDVTAENGEEGDRRYMALFPVNATDEATGPDFHRLEYFQPIDLSAIIQAVEDASKNGVSRAHGLLFPLFSFTLTVLYFSA